MFGDGALTFQEFAMGEPLPLATIHDAVLEFLRDRDDAALYGAQAVNAYVSEPRMTQGEDVVSPRAAVVTPAELIAGKVLSYSHRLGQPKAGTDWRDLAMLLLAFKDLKVEVGPVLDRLIAAGAAKADLQVWRNLVAQEITPANDDHDF